MGLFDRISETFASYTNVQATTTSIASNELENAIRDLSGKYRLGQTNKGSYIKVPWYGFRDFFTAYSSPLLFSLTWYTVPNDPSPKLPRIS